MDQRSDETTAATRPIRARGEERGGNESAKPVKRKGVQHVFVVQRTERLAAHLVRVVLGGPAFAGFIEGAGPEKLADTDKYVKLLMAPAGLEAAPPYDLDELRATQPAELLPVRRTYTVRSIDPAAQTISIDFVVHGDEGVAGPWAAAARQGDLLALSGPGSGYAPTQDPDTEHLLIGDDSALPAIAAALEAMLPTATGRAIVEVSGPDDEIALDPPPGIAVTWLHRGDAEPGTRMAEVAAQLPRPARAVQVFVHGERTAMKAIRAVVADEWGIPRSELSLSAYWALGRAEDRFQAEKREPVGSIFGG